MTASGMTTPTRIRVLMLIKGLGPGGAERLVVETARNADHSLDLRVVSLLDQKRQLVAEVESSGVAVRCLGVTRLADPRWMTRLIRCARQQRPDIVHVHSPALAPFARVASRLGLFGRPRPLVAYTEHSEWPLHRRATRWANAATIPLDDLTLAVSDPVRASMTPASIRPQVVVVHHGIDLEATRSSVAERSRLRREWGFHDDTIVVVTVANYRPEKNYPMLLRACADACSREPRLRFVAVGQGPLADDVRALHGALGLDGKMLLLGYRPDARSVLAAGDVFTLTSDTEGLPVALMEALAIGLPVVATAVGGIAATVTPEVGILVPAGDSRVLADALVSLCGDAHRLDALRSGARHLGDAFDVRRSSEQIARLYRDALSRRR